jgi:hypothetical protein
MGDQLELSPHHQIGYLGAMQSAGRQLPLDRDDGKKCGT